MGANETRERTRKREGDENGVELCDHEVDLTNVAIAAGAVAGLALLAWGFSGIVSAASSSEQRRTMKAPGRDYRIFRDDFEHDPSSYFKSLRK